MGNAIDNANAEIKTLAQKIEGNALFHTLLVAVAAILVVTEQHMPSVKQDIAYGLALLASTGRLVATLGGIASSIAGWVSANGASSSDSTKK